MPFNESIAACASASVTAISGSRLVFWLQPPTMAFSDIGYVSGTVRCFSTSTPRTRASVGERVGEGIACGALGVPRSVARPRRRAAPMLSCRRVVRVPEHSCMATLPDVPNLALFCYFANIALGVRDANYEKFAIGKVLERLLLKGSIVVKKAYCDWERYKAFKAPMHEASFELIEIPHVRQSGKNSADIRMVVDALDLCYTKSHVDTFVIISGDSDFSPLVSKLRENNKVVIGVGVKNSTSDLLIANCDEFIYYDDLVREKKRPAARKTQAKPASTNARPPAKHAAGEAAPPAKGDEERRQEAVDLVADTVEALVAERGEEEKIWGSMVKQALKRRKPGFNESYFGFRSFTGLLEEAATRGAVKLARDENSANYRVRLPGDGA